MLDIAHRRVDTPDFDHTRKTKKCAKCGPTRGAIPVDEFFRNKWFIEHGSRDGLNPVCRRCVSENLSRARQMPRKPRKGTAAANTPAPIGSRGVRVIAGQGVLSSGRADRGPTSGALRIVPPVAAQQPAQTATPAAPISAPAAPAVPAALATISLADYLTNPSPIVPSVWIGPGIGVMMQGTPDAPQVSILTDGGSGKPPFQVPLDGIEWACRMIARIDPAAPLDGRVLC